MAKDTKTLHIKRFKRWELFGQANIKKQYGVRLTSQALGAWPENGVVSGGFRNTQNRRSAGLASHGFPRIFFLNAGGRKGPRGDREGRGTSVS